MRGVQPLLGIRSAFATARMRKWDCSWLYFKKEVCPECKASGTSAPFPEMLSNPVMPQSRGSVIPLCRYYAITQLRYYIVALLHSCVIA